MAENVNPLISRSAEWYAAAMQIAFRGYKERYESGDNGVILEVIHHANLLKLPVPTWAMDGFSKIYVSVRGRHAIHRSWDKAFGSPLPKRRHLSDVRNEISAHYIYINIEGLREHDNRVVDEALFEEVGAKFGVGKTLCSELYYRAAKAWKPASTLDPVSTKKTRTKSTKVKTSANS